MKKKIVIAYGTRPEAIKLFLLVKALSKKYEVITIFTGQHQDLIDNTLIPKPDYSIMVKQPMWIEALRDIFIAEQPNLVICQGDTDSALAIAMAGFYNKIPVGHVEAGLRSHNINSPFPEEFNRIVIDKISDYHWCPTTQNAFNCLQEGLSNIIITGNTIVDTVNYLKPKISTNNNIIVTLHRRENECYFKGMLTQINDLALEYDSYNFVFPVHPNPIISGKTSILKAKNIQIIEPLPYSDMLRLIASCTGIISDSGGICEEACALNKKILICRDSTERSEAIDCGIGKLVGCKIKDNFNWLLEPSKTIANPFGAGNAVDAIVQSLFANTNQQWLKTVKTVKMTKEQKLRMLSI